MQNKFPRLVVAILTLLLAAGCGNFFVSSNTVVSLAVTPRNPSVQPSKTQQFTATGTLGNGNTKDLTAQVTWTSSATGVATINSSGLATAVTIGSATITATSTGGSSGSKVTGTTTMTVTNQVLTSIAVTPANTSLRAGQTQQFVATGTFSDNTTRDITNSVTWASTNTAVATVSNTGLVTAISAGNANISATSGTITNSTGLTVTAF
jgi:uncharacterized protein YjdB